MHQSAVYTIDVELLNKNIVVLVVSPDLTIADIADKIRQYQAKCVLEWPHSRGVPSSYCTQVLSLSQWEAPAAVRISRLGTELEFTRTLHELNLGPYSHLQAHMYFSQQSQRALFRSSVFDELQVPAATEQRPTAKRTMRDEDIDDDREDKKRQKYNEPLRNRHVHHMFGVCRKLELSTINAARYGMDVDDLEDLLRGLEMAADDLRN